MSYLYRANSNNPVLTTKQAESNRNHLMRVLQTPPDRFAVVADDNHTAKRTLIPLRSLILQAIANSQVPQLRGKGRQPKSSAMYPVPETPPQWVIGCYGSVFMDCRVGTHIVRVHLLEDGQRWLWGLELVG
jgi:hypothetical protein